jgi:putative SOS response-associated peptidase YedK
MCGRYTLRRHELARAVFEALREIGFDEFSELDIHWWNIAPSQHVPVVRLDEGGQRVISPAQWGFIPAWARELPKTRPINARAETVSTSGMFRRSFQSSRCLLPADGFYEWQATGGKGKRPHFIHRRDDGLFAFAGIWDTWSSGDKPVKTCALLTTTPNKVMEPIHNRMPVILGVEDYERWLNPRTPAAELTALLVPCADEVLEAYPVSTVVNSPRNDGPECIRRAGDGEGRGNSEF